MENNRSKWCSGLRAVKGVMGLLGLTKGGGGGRKRHREREIETERERERERERDIYIYIYVYLLHKSRGTMGFCGI